jgi:cytoskeleton protein RodZ
LPVGESLTRAREARGLTVDDVSSATRIRAGLIRCIERDDYDACGGAVYARGHIRSIARVIGVDPEPLIEEFDRAHSEESAPTLVAAPMVDAQAAAAAERRGPNWTAAMAVALVAICVLAAIGIVTSNGGGGHPLAGLPPTTTTPTPTPTPTGVAPTPPPNSVADAFDSKRATALLRIRSDQSSPSWISGQNFDGAGIYQATLQAGQQHQFRDPHGLCLVIGNVLAVQLVANGREVHIPRPAGGSVVTHVTIARGKAPTFHSGPTSVCP